jgi:hypothetical protein
MISPSEILASHTRKGSKPSPRCDVGVVRRSVFDPSSLLGKNLPCLWGSKPLAPSFAGGGFFSGSSF